MTKIEFENNGFTLEQKFHGKEFKTFIFFDNVTNKIGYYKSINYPYIILAVMFGIIEFIEITNYRLRILSLIYFPVLLYFLFEFFYNLQKYKTLSLDNSKEIYFKKNEYKFIDEILNNRNKFFYKTYFNNIETYNEKDKINTLNWLYKENVVNKFEILKINGIKYNENKDEFYQI